MTEFIITSSILILIVIVLRHLLKGKINLRLQYALWTLVLVRLLVPGSIGESAWSAAGVAEMLSLVEDNFEMSSLSLPFNKQYEFDSIEDYDKFAMTNRTHSITGGKNPEFRQITSSVDGVVAIVPVTVPWIDVLNALWLVGVAAVGLCLLLSNLSFGRKLKRTRKRFPADGCKLPVYEAQALPSPCLFGFIRPAIYITPDIAEDETRLRHVLAHELTHYRHGDHIWAALRCLCLAIHWYNPLVWLAAKLSRRDAELACDEGSIKRLGEENRIEYGRTLIGLTCEKRSAMELLCCATTMTDGKKGIKERIALIAKRPKVILPALIAVVLVAAVAVGCTFTGAKTDKPEMPSDIPSETPSAAPDFVREYQEIYPVMEKAVEAYAWFTGKGPIELDASKQYFDNGVVWYAVVTREGISSMKELETYLSKLFDDATCRKLLSTSVGKDENIPLFMERDGILYCAAGVVGQIASDDCDWTLGVQTADEESATVVINWSMTVWGTPLSGSYHMYCVKGGAGLWRFKGFLPPVQAAVTAYDKQQTLTDSADAYFGASSEDPVETVRKYLIAEKKQDYTISLDIYEIAVSKSDTAKVIEKFRGSDYAKSKGWTDEYVENNIVTVAAYYSARYDHKKIFFDDGEIIRRYYLEYNEKTALWTIWNNDGGVELSAFLSGNMDWPDCLTKPEKLALGTGTFVTSADIDQDGEVETFYLDKSRMDIDKGDIVTLPVLNSDGNEIWSEKAGLPHAGWNSLFLCRLDGKYYILRYNPHMGQGYCTYVYTLFTPEDKAEKVVRTNKLEFDINGTKALDAPKMVAFADEVNALLENSTLILSSEGGAYTFGPSSAKSFYEEYSWLDGFSELYSENDDLQTRLQKYSDYAASNYARMN